MSSEKQGVPITYTTILICYYKPFILMQYF